MWKIYFRWAVMYVCMVLPLHLKVGNKNAAQFADGIITSMGANTADVPNKVDSACIWYTYKYRNKAACLARLSTALLTCYITLLPEWYVLICQDVATPPFWVTGLLSWLPTTALQLAALIPSHIKLASEERLWSNARAACTWHLNPRAALLRLIDLR